MATHKFKIELDGDPHKKKFNFIFVISLQLVTHQYFFATQYWVTRNSCNEEEFRGINIVFKLTHTKMSTCLCI